jgi:hypothetical protein
MSIGARLLCRLDERHEKGETLMETTLSQPLAIATAPSKKRRFGGIALTALPGLFLAFDACIKFTKIPGVLEQFVRLGFAESLAPTIGIIELAVLVLYVVPRTAVFGAVLLTGFLGGAIVTHLRIGDPLFSHTLFPIYIGTLAWLGLALRDDRVRALAPWAKR